MDSIYDKIKFLVRYLNECTKAYDLITNMSEKIFPHS